jgi:hypothetical protein
MGLIVKKPRLHPDEVVQWTAWANRTRGRTAIGGKLFVTSQRVYFVAHRFEHAFRKAPDVALPHGQIRHVGLEPATADNLYGGSLRVRLRLDLRNSTSEYFVINRQSEVAARLRSTLGMDGADEFEPLMVAASQPELATALPWPVWLVLLLMSAWVAAGRVDVVVNGSGASRLAAGLAAVVAALTAAVAATQIVVVWRRRDRA